MKDLQKIGGIAALYSGIIYVLGMLGYLLVLDYGGVVDPVQKVALLADNQAFMYLLNMIAYVIWGIVMIPLTLALYERLKAGSPAIMQTATAIGLIWATIIIAAGMIFTTGMANVVDLYGKDPAQAATVWLAIDSVFGGLGGSNEVVGALWTLLVSWAALRSGGLPKALNYLGVVVGVAGLISIVPAIATLTIFIFAFGGIVWFIWLGIVMLRGKPSGAA